MYARTSEIQADPANIEDGLRVVREETFPTLAEMDGCVGMSLLVDRSTGRCIATTAWQSEEAMAATAERVRPLRDEAARTLGSTGTSEVHQWEVAVVHRDHAVPEAACARLTWLGGDPGVVDRAVEMFKTGVLPRIEELDGFCSASLLIDRGAGRAVGTAVFDGRDALEASRDAMTAIRERATSEIGATVNAIEELEVGFAHLHVPESV